MLLCSSLRCVYNFEYDMEDNALYLSLFLAACIDSLQVEGAPYTGYS